MSHNSGSGHKLCFLCVVRAEGLQEVRTITWRLVEFRLVPCSTETGELELDNWVGIPRRLKK
jgi:hypothetical protein